MRKWVDHDQPARSVNRQWAVLELTESPLYYRPQPARKSTLRIMAGIDALYLEDPCGGSRRMVDDLAREGIPIGPDGIQSLMHRMGLGAIYRKPPTPVGGDPSGHFPYLVDIKTFTAVDQIWATDNTCTHCRKAFSSCRRSCITSPRTLSTGSSPATLTRSSALRLWKSHSKVAESQRTCTQLKTNSSVPSTSCRPCKWTDSE